MRVLITGATGLVGNEIVAECHRKNIAVNYLTTSKNKIVSKPNYNGFYWNPDTQEIDLACFDGVDVIINLAGASISKRWTPKYKKEILASRVNSLRTLNFGLQQIDTSKIKSIVSASAIGIYPSSLTKYYSEDDEYAANGFLANVVKAWEEEVDSFNSFGFKVVKIRIGLVLSSKGGALPEMAKPIKYYVGSPFGTGEQWQSWIHVKDLARIFVFALENNLQGVYNGVAHNPVTNKKLINTIASILGRPIILPKIPTTFLRLILGEMAVLLVDSQRVSDKKIVNEGFSFKYSDASAALESIYKKQKVS